MKKVFLIFAFALLGQMAFSQTSFKEDVIKLLSINGTSAGLEVAKKQLLPMIPEAKQEQFNKEFTATFPSFYEKMSKVYMEVYTHDDIKEMISFYESPLGKKIADTAGLISEKSMAAGQEWGMELQNIMTKYMQ